MKKVIIITLSFLLSSNFLIAQKSETVVTNQKLFKVLGNPAEDKTDQVEVSGIGQTSFTASNTVDGTANSYAHTLNVTLTLIAVNKTVNNNFRLHFYSPGEEIQQAATYRDGLLNIYYPISFYDAIRSKLEQAFAAKKKVTVKVIQKPNGYREGTLML